MRGNSRPSQDPRAAKAARVEPDSPFVTSLTLATLILHYLQNSFSFGGISVFFSFNNEKFPKCETFAKASLSMKALKQHKPKVWKAFLRAAEVPEADAEDAVAWGNLPQIMLHADPFVSNNQRICAMNRKVFGVNAPTHIEIARHRFNMLEYCITATDLANAKLRLEGTILHEIVHWLRANASLLDPNYNFEEPEPGTQFEKWAYGDRACSQFDMDDSKAAVF
jgi:hypothetical protein